MKRLSGKRAAWLGLLATPVLVVSAVLLAGVAVGSAGPKTAAAPKAAAKATAGTEVVVHQNTQTLAQVKEYWTPERMATATPMPLLEKATAPTSAPEISSGPTQMGLAMMQKDGSVQTTTVSAPNGGQLVTEPYHADIPFSRWQWFGRYLYNQATGANRVIATVAKMFFTQAGVNYVCSASSIGQDAAWTAGHCVYNAPNLGFSTNVLICPSYDSTQGGINPTAGCWGSDFLVVTTCYLSTGDGDCDMGAVNTTNTGTVQPMKIGNFTSWNGMGWGLTNTTGAFNLHWIALGYPQGAPFNGGSIQVAASSLGYVDEWTAGGNYNSVAMGSDLTGGSSGGPWIWQFGRPGQPGGLNGLYLNGHNDWRHVAETGEMNSPFFNCLAVAVYNGVNGTSITCP